MSCRRLVRRAARQACQGAEKFDWQSVLEDAFGRCDVALAGLSGAESRYS